MAATTNGGRAGAPGSEPKRNLTTWLSASGSAVALVVSGVSLWESVLKQPSLRVYVGDSIFYTRDPWGSYEVFVVPITIVNSGAQDGAVISLKLDLTNRETGIRETFESTYTADATWFSGSDNVSNRTKRPKAPFSALAIAGRAAWTGTILFYTPEFREKRIVEPRSQVAGELKISAPRTEGWLERMLGSTPAPIPIAMAVPNFLPGALLSGDVARVKVSWPGSGAPPPINAPAPQPIVKGALPDWGGPLQKKEEAK